MAPDKKIKIVVPVRIKDGGPLRYDSVGSLPTTPRAGYSTVPMKGEIAYFSFKIEGNEV